MPELDDIEYSRDECVKAVRDYFHFLFQMYLDESDFLYPPAAKDGDEGGWPSITADNLASVDKDETVIDLLRHLPFVRQRSSVGGSDTVKIAPFTTFANWEEAAANLANGREDAESVRVFTEGATLSEILPPHVVGLTSWTNSDVIVLDTDLGIVLWYECPGEIVAAGRPVRPVSDDPYDYEEDEEQAEWRGDSTAWSIPDFFKMLENQFRKLEFVPITKTKVWVTHPYFHAKDRDAVVPQVREIYRKHHWPDLAQYDKVSCQAEIKALLDSSFPNLVDHFEE
ncbi:hypothetical protein SPBR_03141 [Sporothrix brasiliensis 5110]|uniref:Uncharacterized protein n=1 Tax=Sporothrix brasiliensis 5110 TaxID=1398154 RepID=A0A0C2J7Y9_9PEZI|nr:uncharacterized protein SPBR_03141 [Sporothrix brasiliensis 5110]KIH93117.1 hypothetical protein SPBR_03141 [Sporothrix brasiliensis 5110]